MSKTITKFVAFVICGCVPAVLLANCTAGSSGISNNSGKNDMPNAYQTPRILGTIRSDEIRESSGLAASHCSKDVFWTHNDSGDGAFIYALNAKGEKLGTYKVAGSENVDWEDIAAARDDQGRCFLYIGDIGNNARARDVFTVYRIKEPIVAAGDRKSSRKDPLTTGSAESIRFSYPDGRRDAEALMVNPRTGDIYILSKRFGDPSGVYKLAAGYQLDKPNKLKKIADLKVPAIPDGLLTGGDISPDGRRIVVCDYFSAYEIVQPADAAYFDDIWKQKPLIVDLGEREQGESVAYSADGQSIMATSEKGNSPLIEVKRR